MQSTNLKIEARIATSLLFIKNCQRSDGSFSSATFTTSLILACLENVTLAGAENKIITIVAKQIIQNGIRFLLNECSPDWSWNYWSRGAPRKNKTLNKIPDDIDDTFAALLAIHIHRPKMITPAVIKKIKRHLHQTACTKTRLHNTWLLQNPKNHWKNVDLIVNSTVAYTLTRLGGKTAKKALNLKNEIIKNNLKNRPTSRYYTSPIVRYYFMSRLLREGYVATEKLVPQNALETALLLTSLMQRGVERNELAGHVSFLLKSAWPADNLHIESIENKIPTYAGSEALTTAFCIEALSTYLTYTSHE